VTYALDLFLWNLVILVPITMVVWLLCRTRIVRQQPALCHALWLLVLLKLVTPPLVPIPVLPAMAVERGFVAGPPNAFVTGTDLAGGVGDDEPPFAPNLVGHEKGSEATAFAVESSIRGSGIPTSGVEPLRVPRNFVWQGVVVGLLGLSLSVSIVVWLAGLRQLHRVRRLLRGSAAESGRAADLVREVSRRYNLRSAPDLVLVDASITPMLWVAPGRCAIVLSRQLADLLDDDHLRHVAAHEIAHYVRRDHWTDLFAFFVASLYWWNPIAWLARRAMTDAAEASCDALALQRMAGSRRSYAATLLAVIDFTASNDPSAFQVSSQTSQRRPLFRPDLRRRRRAAWDLRNLRRQRERSIVLFLPKRRHGQQRTSKGLWRGRSIGFCVRRTQKAQRVKERASGTRDFESSFARKLGPDVASQWRRNKASRTGRTQLPRATAG